MDKPVKFAWGIFTGRFELLLIILLTTTLPLLLFHSFITNYIYAITPNIAPNYSFADIYYALITVLIFLYAQVPIIRFTYNEYIGRDHSLRDALYQFLINGFNIFVYACIVAVLTTIGFAFFIIPGLIVLSLVIPISYLAIFDEKSVWKSYREGIRIGKKHILKIFGVITLIGFLEFMIGIIVVYGVFLITSSFLAQIMTQIVLNLIFYPFVIILLTALILKWRESQKALEIEPRGAGTDGGTKAIFEK